MKVTKETVNRYLDRADGDKLMSKYYNTAFARVHWWTCQALSKLTVGSLFGVVGADGKTITFPGWMSELQYVSDAGGHILPCDFNPDQFDFEDDGTEGKKYTKIATLKTAVQPGDGMTFTGTWGFKDYDMPAGLAHAIIDLMVNLEAKANGTDAIKSKSIEDVSVTRDTEPGKTPAQKTLDSMQQIIDRWSLCHDMYRIGDLAYPDPTPDQPYYLASGDKGGGVDHVVGSVG